jgi:[protein-PII] uridylyltransferase
MNALYSTKLETCFMHVKRGRGGLRDIQRWLWLAQLGHHSAGHEAAAGALEPPATLVEARRFLWQVRAHLHLIAGGAQDRLRHDLQPAVATRLGIGRGAAGAAALLRAYRRHMQSVRTLLKAV